MIMNIILIVIYGSDIDDTCSDNDNSDNKNK